MKRIVCLIVLLAFSAPASARDSYFTFHGHRIHISALRHCRSLSCIRASVPGLGHGRHDRDRDVDVDTTPNQVSPPAPVAAPAPPPQPAPAPAPPPALPQASPAPVPAPVQTRPASPPIQAQHAPVQSPPLPPVTAQVPMLATRSPVAASATTLAAAAPEQIARTPIAQPSARQETTASTPNPAPSVGFEVQKPQSASAPVANTQAAAQPKAGPPLVANASDDSEEESVDTPLGDWQTDGKNGLVRIETCGASLCGYVLDTLNSRKGRDGAGQHETEVLRDMERQHLQPHQRQHLLRRYHDEGAEHAQGRSLRAWQVHVLRQRLDADRAGQVAAR